MKLLNKYNRVNLASTIGIFLLSGIAFYFVIHYTLLRQLDGDLLIEKNEIETYVKENGELPRTVELKDQQINFSPVSSAANQEFITIDAKNGDEPRRRLTFPVRCNDHWYTATVTKSLEGTESIIRSVVLITLFTIILVLASSFVLNRNIFKSLWKPFYQSLNAMKDYRIGERKPLQLQDNNIDEFRFLNQTLEQSTGKASRDYEALKEFTENASHELQTPLAIIRSKLELLMQGPGLTEQHSHAVNGATEAISKLARLNHALLILARIGNNQFFHRQAIHMHTILSGKMDQFSELWEEKRITVSSALSPVTVDLNEELVEMLLNNLLSNAIRHNVHGGRIRIMLNREQLSIANTGDGTALSPDGIFSRFYNPAGHPESNGLGLAVVKEICDSSGILISYSFVDGMHQFTLGFVSPGAS